MLRKSFLLLGLLPLLGACGTLSAIQGGGTSTEVTAAFVADAQAAASGFCAIAPTAETIVSLVSNDPALATATAAAQAFCTLVNPTKMSARRKVARRLVMGVVDYGSVTLPNGKVIELKGTPQ